MKKLFAAKSPEVTEREKLGAALARQLAADCVVLMRNDGVLPLNAGGKIALFGSGARRTVKGGTGSGDVYTRTSTTIEQGLAEAGFTVTTTAWLDRHDAKAQRDKAAYDAYIEEKMAEHGWVRFLAEFTYHQPESAPETIADEDIAGADTDTAIFVISRNSGEGADRFNARGDWLLYEEEKMALQKLGAAFPKLVVLLNVGGVMDTAEIDAIPGVGALVLMNQLGSVGGAAICDVLTGKVTPSGKLADTWADYDAYPSSANFSHNNGDVNDEYYTDGVYVGYRYFDSFGVTPRYPFGFGLSYTTFAVEALCAKLDGSTASVDVRVTNTGDTYAGREVAQLYVSAPDGRLHKPAKELRAFGKTRLLTPGESQTLTLRFDMADCASFDEAANCYVLEPGAYVLYVGASVCDAKPCATVMLAQEIVTRKTAAWTGAEHIEGELAGPKRGAAPETSVVLTLCPEAIRTETFCAPKLPEPMVNTREETLTMADLLAGRCTAEELTAQLSVREMAELCVGAMRTDTDGCVVGNASVAVPGAAGDTSTICEECRGIRPLILADGPAGLRLTPHFAVTADGRMVMDETALNSIGIQNDTVAANEKVQDYYQYCTAIPVGWALAQAWDDDLLRAAGDIVGGEMETFGVDLWLAPALNIHRNPLCGRNFEYYSEDPLVSGHAAAAITQGVQRHAGRGTTIKHFAVNNMEDNRYFSNSHVGERALREIYLRGFEYAVKASQPMSLMTSYNLLNGEHTANSRFLMEQVLRGEWGFAGFVMTDWFTSQDAPQLTGENPGVYPISASSGCIAAGNDVQMPGCAENADDIVRAVESGTPVDGYSVTLAQLQHCCRNLLCVIARCEG